jgi:simple sugar transport system ATP-binding protein
VAILVGHPIKNIKMENFILELKNITKNFPGVKALSGVSLNIKKGEIHCLVGENGSGKSTLIKIASGFNNPDSGEIYINGNYYKKLKVREAIKEGIQVIYQDLALYSNLSVGENIALNQLIEKNVKFINNNIIRNIAQSSLDELKNIKLDLNSLVDTLSMGDKQIVAICRALTHDAKLIIMDEPTVALTRNEIELLFEVILHLKKKGISTLFLSHKISEVFKISEKVTVIRDGFKVGEFDTGELNHKNLVFHMTGKEVSNDKYYYPYKNPSNILLEVKNLTKKNNFKNISFKLFAGEIIGITGLLGSGRTELALSLFGLNKAEKGEILVSNKKVKINSVRDAIKAGIGYLPQDRMTEGLFVNKPIDINTVISSMFKLINKFKLINHRLIKKISTSIVEELEIKTSSIDNLIQNLSGGNQQKVVIGKWMLTNPKILILDSPTVGVDIASKYNLHRIIRKFALENKIGIIIISDEIPEVIENCNRILLMKKGEIIDIVYPDKTNEDEIFEKIIQ